VATVFRLADYAQTAGTIVDLHAGTLKLEAESWSSRTAPMEGSYKYTKFGAQPKFDHLGVMVENFGLIGDDTVANLITGHNKIMAVIEKARLYHEDPLQGNSWWLEANANGEDPKRALLYEGSLQALTGVGLDPLMATKKLRLGCSLSRHPLWETVTATTETHATSVSLTGGMWVPSTIPVGTCPGRIATWNFTAMGTGSKITRMWTGIRPTYNGTAGFTALQECEAGSLGTDATVADEGAQPDSAGHHVLVSFTTTTAMAQRLRMTVTQMGGTVSHYKGRYLVLLRCKVSEGTMAVQMKTGMPGASATAVTESAVVYVTNVSYQLLDLGEVQIPPYRVCDTTSAAWGAMEVQFWAERVAGVGTLTMDAFILMPSQHMVYGDELNISGVAGSTGFSAYMYPDDMPFAESVASVPFSVTEYLVRDPYWPVEGGVMVCAGEPATGHELALTIKPALTVFPRWYNFRG
jgi:hypothetical protein